jgi:MSHA biogenesis protein MshM
MPLDTLETLRLLTNLETEKRKLLQVVMFGQPELDHKLEHHSIRQMRQRITFQHRLGALTREETEHYLSHRLEVAAYQGDRVFSSAAVGSIFRASRGVPRLINILANKSMMLAYGRGSRRVGWSEARAAASDTPAAFSHAPRWLWFALACFAGSGIGWMLLR